jgi:hypothetical protein
MYEPSVIDVSVPKATRSRQVEGVRRHRRRILPASRRSGLPRVDVPLAAINGAAWAVSDRQAVLILCLVLQQRLTTPERLSAAWNECRTHMSPARQALLRITLGDLCNGAHSLGELDFAGLCREYGLPEPSRQVVRALPGGRVYLDAAWEDVGLVVEVDGGHHALALHVVDDALRQNSVVLREERVLRLPCSGCGWYLISSWLRSLRRTDSERRGCLNSAGGVGVRGAAGCAVGIPWGGDAGGWGVRGAAGCAVGIPWCWSRCRLKEFLARGNDLYSTP